MSILVDSILYPLNTKIKKTSNYFILKSFFDRFPYKLYIYFKTIKITFLPEISQTLTVASKLAETSKSSEGWKVAHIT